ncbi:hypothetical protein [Polymorphospora lycopeni]|uniref:Uncharacterized protein n=1 Tax=Polymorphospora lycopeni TaxID=3140240 RepID=A0ABV5D232_9ACTN
MSLAEQIRAKLADDAGTNDYDPGLIVNYHDALIAVLDQCATLRIMSGCDPSRFIADEFETVIARQLGVAAEVAR